MTARVVYKYPLNPYGPPQTVRAIAGDVVLVAYQHDQGAHIWILGDPDDVIDRTFVVAATGQAIPDAPSLRHVGSFLDGPLFVWHVFEDRPRRNA